MKNDKEKDLVSNSIPIRSFSEYLGRAQYLVDNGFVLDRSVHEVAEQMQRNDEEKSRKTS